MSDKNNSYPIFKIRDHVAEWLKKDLQNNVDSRLDSKLVKAIIEEDSEVDEMFERFMVWRISAGNELLCGQFKLRKEAEDYIANSYTNMKAHGVSGIRYVIQPVKQKKVK